MKVSNDELRQEMGAIQALERVVGFESFIRATIEQQEAEESV